MGMHSFCSTAPRRQTPPCLQNMVPGVAPAIQQPLLRSQLAQRSARAAFKPIASTRREILVGEDAYVAFSAELSPVYDQ